MDNQLAYQEIKKRLKDRNWRLNNLYYIIDKQGHRVQLKLNYFQKFLLNHLWFLNLILKARQLGMSTFVVIFMLDVCLFNSNKTSGIIDYTLKDAKKKLAKAKFAYDSLPTSIQEIVQLSTDNVQELRFSNGSSMTADTSFRGDTVQLLLISEYAKICKHDPIRAEEIKTGALNAVAIGQFVFIESTSEGSEGHFYDISKNAENMQIENKELSKLDYKFFFFPWWKNPEYILKCPKDFTLGDELTKYFNRVESKEAVKITREQKFFYFKKYELLQEDIKKEFPSDSKEAFEATDKDKYYQSIIQEIRAKNQISEYPIEKGIEVLTSWDLGIDDYTAITFYQIVGKEIRVVDYLEGSGEEIGFYAEQLKRKGYLYGYCYLPHDANTRTLSTKKTVYIQLTALGFKCLVIPAMGVEIGINEVRRLLPRMWFRRSATTKLIEHLEKYAKKWNRITGQFSGPKHDEHSHGADSVRTYASQFIEIKTKRKQTYAKRRSIYDR